MSRRVKRRLGSVSHTLAFIHQGGADTAADSAGKSISGQKTLGIHVMPVALQAVDTKAGVGFDLVDYSLAHFSSRQTLTNLHCCIT